MVKRWYDKKLDEGCLFLVILIKYSPFSCMAAFFSSLLCFSTTLSCTVTFLSFLLVLWSFLAISPAKS